MVHSARCFTNRRSLFPLDALPALDLVSQYRQPKVDLCDLKLVFDRVGAGHKLPVRVERLLVFSKIIVCDGNVKIRRGDLRPICRDPFVHRQAFGILFQLKERDGQICVSGVIVGGDGEHLA